MVDAIQKLFYALIPRNMIFFHFFSSTKGEHLFFDFTLEFRQISANFHLTEIYTKAKSTVQLLSFHFESFNISFTYFVPYINFFSCESIFTKIFDSKQRWETEKVLGLFWQSRELDDDLKR